MIKTIRAQSPVLLTTLFVLISASLLVFYNIPQRDPFGAGRLGKIDGQEVGTEEFKLAQQAVHESVLYKYGRDLSNSQDSTLTSQTWQRLVLLAEAKKLGIIVTDKECADFILYLAILQKEGKFDPDAYDRLQKYYLPSRGLSQDRFEQIIREEVTLQKVQDALLSPVQVTESDIATVLNQFFGSIKVSLVRWNKSDFLPQVKVEPADIEKEYKLNAMNPAYRTAEQRQVAFVSFLLTPDQAKLADAAKAAAKRALGEKATDFAVAVVDQMTTQPDAWDALAKAKGLSALTTDYFAQNEAPKAIPPSPAFNRSVFQLNKELPISDAVEIDNGYVVIRLLDIKPSELRPLDEIRPVIEQNLRAQGANEVLRKHADEIVASLQTEIGKGKTLAAAASDLKLTVESPAAFSPWQAPPSLKDGDSIVEATRTLQPGQLTSYVPSENGGFVVFLESRAQPTTAMATMLKPRIQAQLLQQRRQSFIQEWFHLREQMPDIKLPQSLQEK